MVGSRSRSTSPRSFGDAVHRDLGGEEAIFGTGGGLITPLPSPLLRCYSVAVSFVAACAQCREEVLDADQIGDEEECVLRDHLLAVHQNTIQPETLGVLLRYFVVIERPPPAA